MSAILLDGKKLSDKIKSGIKSEIEILKSRSKKIPTLSTIFVGDNQASGTYVSIKIRACESVGIKSRLIKLPEKTNTEELLGEIRKLNEDEDIHGILLQHPCPPHIDERKAFDLIDPKKDVDGVTSSSFGKLSMGMQTFLPCTPSGIMLLLHEYGIDISGKRAVVVGRSPILGKPVAMLLLNKNATVTICHSKTKNLNEIVREAEIVVGAVGKPQFIKSGWIREGAVLLDAGYNKGNIGDIEISKAASKSSYYTPVPGGVGPMTIAVLLRQTLDSLKENFTPASL